MAATPSVESNINILAGPEGVQSDAIREAVEEYLDDVNETVRFHAVQTTFHQDNEASLPALVELCKNEESVRIKNKVCDGIEQKGWKIPEDLREEFKAALRDVTEYRMASDGTVKKI